MDALKTSVYKLFSKIFLWDNDKTINFFDGFLYFS